MGGAYLELSRPCGVYLAGWVSLQSHIGPRSPGPAEWVAWDIRAEETLCSPLKRGRRWLLVSLCCLPCKASCSSDKSRTRTLN